MILYLDIETYREYNTLDECKLKELFIQRYVKGNDDYKESEDIYRETAALYPEFGIIICISIGYFSEKDNTFHKISIIDPEFNEVNLLNKFSTICASLEKYEPTLAGYNIKYFDMQFIIKRYLINSIPVPKLVKDSVFYPGTLNMYKPWDSPIIDVMDIYKMGSVRSTSLGVACRSMGIKCKSSEVTGVNMFMTPLKDLDIQETKDYCEEDIYSTYLLYEKLKSIL